MIVVRSGSTRYVSPIRYHRVSRSISMLTLIIIIIVAAFAIGFLKNLTAQERAIVMGRTLNATKYGVTGVVKVTKSTVNTVYNAGQIAGIELAIQGQDTLASMNDFNTEVASKGGAIKQAVQDVNNLTESMGLSTVNVDMKKTIQERSKVLAEMRAKINK